MVGGTSVDAVPALELRGLTKRYDDGLLALDGFDLTVPDGAFFGLLGPNGAGKTTLISAVRYGFLGHSGTSVALSLAVTAVLAAACLGWSSFLFATGRRIKA